MNGQTQSRSIYRSSFHKENSFRQSHHRFVRKKFVLEREGKRRKPKNSVHVDCHSYDIFQIWVIKLETEIQLIYKLSHMEKIFNTALQLQL